MRFQPFCSLAPVTIFDRYQVARALNRIGIYAAAFRTMVAVGLGNSCVNPLAAAEILALPAALIPPFFLGAGLAFGFAVDFAPLIATHGRNGPSSKLMIL
jgi:hypothetical protein